MLYLERSYLSCGFFCGAGAWHGCVKSEQNTVDLPVDVLTPYMEGLHNTWSLEYTMPAHPYTYMYVYIYTRTHSLSHIYIYVCMYLRMTYVCMFLCVPVRILRTTWGGAAIEQDPERSLHGLLLCQKLKKCGNSSYLSIGSAGFNP